MKKMFLYILCALLFLTCVSCDNNIDPVEKATEKPMDTSTVRYPTEQHIPKVEDLLSQWQGYVQDLTALYESAEKVEQYSVYDIETLGLTYDVICAFYNNGQLTTTRYFSVKNDRISLPDNITEYDGEGAVRTLNDCVHLFPNFEVIGFLGELTPIGRLNGEENILIYDIQEKELEPFKRVEADFSNMEKGFELRAEYLANQARIEADIPVFRWKNADDHTDDNGYYDIYAPVDYYDRIFVCPLLDSDGKEGVYLCHLLYLRNRLVGEVISTEDEPNIFKHFGDYDDITETYSPIESSFYIKAIEDFAKKNPKKTVKGVCFDGEKYVVISE